MDDIQNLFKETIAEFVENGLDAELDDELGYSKYDYKNKDTDNSCNAHSSNTLRTSVGDVEVSVPRDRKGEFEPQILKKNQTSISQDIKKKILSMYRCIGFLCGEVGRQISENRPVLERYCPNLSTYFKYPQEVRRLIYTTNAMEGFNRQLQKVTKAKSVFPTDDSLFIMLYLAMMDITKSGPTDGWTGARFTHRWPSILPTVCRTNEPGSGMSRAEAHASALDMPSKSCHFVDKVEAACRRFHLENIIFYLHRNWCLHKI